MAGAALQIDDDYCNAMGQYFINEGKEIEGFLNEYISILESIKSTSIKKGNVANALESYIESKGRLMILHLWHKITVRNILPQLTMQINICSDWRN